MDTKIDARMMRIATVAGLATLLASGAQADWQKTRWGMSAGEAASVYPEARPTSEIERAKAHERLLVPLLQMPWNSGDYRFTATFAFDTSGQLTCVYLRLLNNQLALSLVGSLRQKYGAAVEHISGTLYESYRWYAESDAIHLFHSRPAANKPFDDTTIRYCARNNANNRGL